MRYILRKDEKLRHKKLVEDLFAKGDSIYEFPIRLVWRKLNAAELKESFRAEVPGELGEMQMLITIPKKKRRHAVDRVLMRRRIREAYRLNRLRLKAIVSGSNPGGTLSLAFIYLCDKNLPYSTIESRMRRLLDKLERKLSDTNQANSNKEAIQCVSK